MSEDKSSEWSSNGIRFRTESNEDGFVKCFADFSGFVRDITDLMSNQITDEILDGCEAELNRHGWFKERTCKMVRKPTIDPITDKAVCSNCGHFVLVSVSEHMPNYCSNCRAKVVNE